MSIYVKVKTVTCSVSPRQIVCVGLSLCYIWSLQTSQISMALSSSLWNPALESLAHFYIVCTSSTHRLIWNRSIYFLDSSCFWVFFVLFRFGFPCTFVVLLFVCIIFQFFLGFYLSFFSFLASSLSKIVSTRISFSSMGGSKSGGSLSHVIVGPTSF